MSVLSTAEDISSLYSRRYTFSVEDINPPYRRYQFSVQQNISFPYSRRYHFSVQQKISVLSTAEDIFSEQKISVGRRISSVILPVWSRKPVIRLRTSHSHRPQTKLIIFFFFYCSLWCFCVSQYVMVELLCWYIPGRWYIGILGRGGVYLVSGILVYQPVVYWYTVWSEWYTRLVVY